MTTMIGLASYKGGVGKTTLAWNLAERGFAAGLSVCLVDLDPQAVAESVAGLRAPDLPGWEIRPGEISVRGSADLERMRGPGLDLVVCDFPGAEDRMASRLLREMDLTLCPVGSSPPDLIVSGYFADEALRWGWKAYFVGNNLPVGRQRRGVMLEELGKYGLGVVPGSLFARVAHRDALGLGLGVCEHLPASKAAEEVDGLWQWVSRHLRLNVGNEEERQYG